MHVTFIMSIIDKQVYKYKKFDDLLIWQIVSGREKSNFNERSKWKQVQIYHISKCQKCN